MRFQIVSHACMYVEAGGKRLLIDPWIVGSSYWRSWWNYPPPPRELVDSLQPDFIYLTHVHWDHFHGPSLRKFPKTIKILVPMGHYRRIRTDLEKMGYENVQEMKHGERLDLAPGFSITSYSFNPFLDSALAIRADGTTILNANDAKFMGEPLDQILKETGKIDFVMRSHSSANGRLCYEVVDAPEQKVDDVDAYMRTFALFTKRTGAKYAVPFASNHCHLHADAFKYNELVQTPIMVENYFRDHGIQSPELKVMLPGDSWSTEDGFQINAAMRVYFEDRPRKLEEYRQEKAPILAKQAALEARSKITHKEMSKYFAAFSAALPLPIRYWFRNAPITWILDAGEKTSAWEVNLFSGEVKELPSYTPKATDPLEVYTSAFVMRQCIGLDLFSHLPISKRVRYRVSTKTIKYIQRMNLLFNLYEYDFLPVKNLATRRFVENWLLRWREVLLFSRIGGSVALGRGFKQDRYLAG